jgi:hypothetical protein
LDIFNVLSIGANIGNEIESGIKNMLTVDDKIQIAVADVLTQFMFCKNEQDFYDTFARIEKQYGLEQDPFTGCPCSQIEYEQNKLEYDKQIMIEKYGHCDGLE